MCQGPITLFSWGYWGWGASPGRFVQAADAVERSRGFGPPLFVDIRIRRGVRAPGFRDAAFERSVGEDRYRWIRSLGNASLDEGGVRIQDPEAAEELLTLALERSRARQRILFFCACEHPGREERNGCHRVTVARLVLEAAARRCSAPVRIQEWPGGEPRAELDILVPAHAAARLGRGAKSILLGERAALDDVAGIPWYSIATIRGPDRQRHPSRVMTGPARYDTRAGWYLPNLGNLEPTAPLEKLHQLVRELRARDGFAGRDSRPAA